MASVPKKIWKDSYQLYIGGEWRDAEGGKTFDVYNPANGDYMCKVAAGSKQDVDDAVKAAWKAFPEWKKTSATERAAILLKIADIIEANKEHLAMIETLDNGKPIRETMNVDIPLGIDHFRYFASVIRAEEGSAVMLDENTLSIVLNEPLGTVCQIIPWNFSHAMWAWKVAPALAAGCCIVMKPSSSTSLSPLEAMKLIEKELPPGVLNVVTGSGGKTGQYLLDHPDISKLAFTGSTEVGYSVADAAAKKLIPATLELGGKSANIYFDDCNFDKAIDGACLGILFNQGQVCCAGSRIFVQDTIYDKFIAALKAKFESVKVGLPWEPDTQMGSQIDMRQLEKILNYVEIGKAEGAQVITGGAKAVVEGGEKGAFMQPTLLVDVNNSMRVACEEIFGPVAVVIKFHDEDEVIKMANDSEYGLGGAVWTQDINRAIRVSRAIETGRVWINCYNELPAGAPFGGYKKSGIGRETHKLIMNAYTQKKNIYISLSEAPSGLY